MVESKFSKLAIASFVLGVLGWILIIFILSFYKYKNGIDVDIFVSIMVFSVLFIPIWLSSFVCGIIALTEIKKNKLLKGKKFAICGIMLSLIPYIVDIVVFIILLSSGSFAS